MRKARAWWIGLAAAVLVVVSAWAAADELGLVELGRFPPPRAPLAMINIRRLNNEPPLQAASRAPYQVEGSVAGLTAGTEAPADLLVVIHGFNCDPAQALSRCGLAQQALAANGFRGAVVGFSWDADTPRDPLSVSGYGAAKANALAGGPALAQFIADYHHAAPATRLHLFGHSLGALMILEALRSLAQDRVAGSPPPVATVHLAAAAVDSRSIERDGRYGPAIATECQALYNYYSPRDPRLACGYRLYDTGSALGQVGGPDSALLPSNYHDHDAARQLPKAGRTGALESGAYGQRHSGYFGLQDRAGGLIDDGVMDWVAAYIQVAGRLAASE